MAFLEKLDRFYGTGERNREGQTLEEFLTSYNPKKYDCPSNTTDIVVVRCKERLIHWGQPLQVLMVKRSNHPSIGCWATPGGFVEMKEDLFEGAARELEEETGVKGLPLKQLETWGRYDRDPRWRVITTSFLALAEGDILVKAGDDAADALWMDISLEREEAEKAGEEGAGKTKDGGAAAPKSAVWRLSLTNAEQKISLSARVKISRSGHALLLQETYELLESRGIAVDHGCLIVQALLYLRSRLPEGEGKKG